MRLLQALLVGLLGCSPGDTPTHARSTTKPDSPIGSGAVTSSPEGSCAPAANALRFDCTLSLPFGSTASWSVWQDGQLIRRFETPSGAEHALTLWGLAPETDFTWEAVTDAGKVWGDLRTGALPASMAGLAFEVSGTAAEVDHLALPWVCGEGRGMAIVGADGVVRWYEDYTDSWVDGLGPMVDWVRGDAVLSLNDGRLRMLHASGQLQIDVAAPTDRVYHHDLNRVGEHIVALWAEEVDGFVVDGVDVFDLTGARVGSWRLDEAFTPASTPIDEPFWDAAFPGAEDFGHANSVAEHDATRAILSLRNQHTVFRLVIDPDDPAFGTVDQVVVGNPASIAGDVTWPDGGGFEMQHHATAVDGGLALFDNGDPSAAVSRALVIALDGSAGTARIAQAWPMERNCPFQGGVYRLPGGAVATCPASGTMHEFRDGSPDPVWTVRATCDNGGASPTTLPVFRATPVFLD